MVLGGGLGVLAASATGVSLAAAASKVVIATKGEAFAIVADREEAPEIGVAIDEITEHVEAVTGIRPEVVAADPGRPAIWLGTAALGRIAGGQAPDAPHGFLLRVARQEVLVLGGSPQGTLHGVYELLERCGVRWLMPGPHGTVLPKNELALAPGEVREEPAFAHRVLQGVSRYVSVPATSPVNPTEAATWYRRQRLDAVSYGSHVLPMWPATTNKTDPELYIKSPTGAVTPHLNVTLPEVLDRAEAGIRRLLETQPDMDILNIGPADGLGFGETDWDVPGRIDPLYGEVVVTDRYIRFFNLLLDRLADHPKLKLAFYAYATYMEPPVREKPNPRIIPVFAPIAVDRRKSIADDDGWERRYVLRVIEEWKALGVDWMYRGYLGNLADPGLPFSASKQLAAEFAEFAQLGASGGVRLEVIAGWGHNGPALYLASKLMWDPSADAAAILRDWFRAAYGSSAAPMHDYFDRLESTVAAAPFTAGGMFDMADSLPDEVMTALQASLTQAAGRASGSTAVASRIEVVQRAHTFGTDALASWRAHLRGDTSAAVTALARARASHDAAMTISPAPLYPAGKSYLERYLGLSVDQTAAARTSYGHLVATAPRTWQLLVDDQRSETIPTGADGTWSTIDTGLTWSAQGLRYFKGQAWYRCTVPGAASPGRPQLLLPDVDESCQVWVNGIAVPALTTPRSFLPMRFDLGAAWMASGNNDVLVLVTNRVLDEVGTGGLLGTAMVLADPAVAWTPPTLTAPPSVVPAPGPDAPVAPAGAVPVGGAWEAILDPVAAADRLALYDPRISSQHFRTYDPMRSPSDLGLGRYRGGLVVRTVVPTGPRRRLLLAAPVETRVWINSQPVTLTEAGGGWVEGVVPHTPGRTAMLVVGLPRLSAQTTPLAPHWSKR